MYNLQELKRQAGLEPYRKHINVNLPNNKHILCPFPDHDDKTTSFRVNEYNGEYRWICTCGSGDCISFLQRKEGGTVSDAIRTLRRMADFTESQKPLASALQAQPVPHDSYEMQERAAIIEYDGGLSREQAESIARRKNQQIYSKSTLHKHDYLKIAEYLGTRGLKLTDSEIWSFGLCINAHKDKTYLVYPIRNIEGEVLSMGRIELDSECKKIGKTKLLGKLPEDCCFSFNTGKENCYIFEGIEDALSFYLHAENGGEFSYIVTSSINGYAKIASFLKSYKDKILICDNDENGASLKASERLRDHGVKRLVSDFGGYKDANEALQKGEFQAWHEGLREHEYKYEGSKDDAVKSTHEKLEGGHTAFELSRMYFEPVKWIVKGLIPTGLTLISGKPKIGKSWFCLDTALNVATGCLVANHLETNKCDVIYLSLEDNKRRLKWRINMLYKDKEAPNNVMFFYDCKRLDDGGLESIVNHIDASNKVGLVIIDTLAKVRSSAKKGQSIYDSDYQALSGLKKLADNKDIAVVVVHHLRKMGSDDPFDKVSGTMGLTGAADTVLIIEKENRIQADAVLYVSGRDVQDNEAAMRLDPETCQWQWQGDAQAYRISKCKREICNVLDTSVEPMAPKQIADAVGRSATSVKNDLAGLLKDGQIIQSSRGKYLSNKQDYKQDYMYNDDFSL